MILAAVLYICAVVALLQGVPALLDANTIMQQNFGAIHILGGLIMFGVAFAIQRIENFGKELTSWKKDLKTQQEAKVKAEAK
jgi:hypothetical protein